MSTEAMTNEIIVRLRPAAETGYGIAFSPSLPHIARDIVRRFPGVSRFVITDTNVGPMYGRHFRTGGAFHVITVAAGERSKTRRVKERLEDTMLALGASRDSVLVALGGGMVGDLAGFAASTLLRGIRCVQVPTSLLAQVDSSVGGKVAVDHPLGKNLIGAFHQPARVYVCVGALQTLPEREYRSGLAEVVKYAAILDRTMFLLLERDHRRLLRRDRAALTRVIRRCCELKRSVVEKDEKESGLRRILNFGHTIGHAAEHASRYRLLHGEAVSIGMAAEAKLSAVIGVLSQSDRDRLERLLRLFGLPTTLPSPMRSLERSILHDKKMRGGEVHYTLLRSLGRAEVGIPLKFAAVRKVLGR